MNYDPSSASSQPEARSREACQAWVDACDRGDKIAACTAQGVYKGIDPTTFTAGTTTLDDGITVVLANIAESSFSDMAIR